MILLRMLTRGSAIVLALLLLTLICSSCSVSTTLNPNADLSVETWRQGHYTLRTDEMIFSARIPRPENGQYGYELLIFNHGTSSFPLSPTGGNLQLLYRDQLITLASQLPASNSLPAALPEGGSVKLDWLLTQRILVDFDEVEKMIFTMDGIDYQLVKNYDAIWAD